MTIRQCARGPLALWVRSSLSVAVFVAATALLTSSPAASQESLDDSLTSENAVNTLGLTAFDPAQLQTLRADSLNDGTIDPWRQGSSSAETWALATAQNLSAQTSEYRRLELEGEASIARAEVSGLAMSSAINREQVIEYRLRALVVDSFVNGESDALDKLAGNRDRIYVETPAEVATESLSARRQRVAEIAADRTNIRQERSASAEHVLDRVRTQSYSVDEASELDRASRRATLGHGIEIRDRRAQVLAVSGEAPETVLVGGFRVSPEIADSFGRMLAAAASGKNVGGDTEDDAADVDTSEAAGDPDASGEPPAETVSQPIILGGWAYRSTEEQINLRLNHCGESGFSIFDGPSPACSPPTARPLHSQHESGLAIDFTENGVILNSSSPAYFWLQRNAAAFGFFNLPSEPWHWSTTGH